MKARVTGVIAVAAMLATPPSVTAQTELENATAPAPAAAAAPFRWVPGV